MATKHDEFKVYYFSFTDDELDRIDSALRVNGDDELADEITEEIYDGCGDCDYDESGSIGNLTIDIDYSAATEAREELDKLAEAAREVQVAAKDLAAAFGCENISMDRVDAMLKEVFGEVRR